MLGYEFFKNRAVFLLLSLLLIVKCFVSSQAFAWTNTPYHSVYRQYIMEIGGEYSIEKEEYVEQEYETQSKILQQRQSMEYKFQHGEITFAEYEEYMQKHASAQIKTTVLSDLKRQSSHLRRLYEEKGVLGSYIFAPAFEKYTGQSVDWLLMIFICVLCCNSFMMEFGKTSSRGAVISLIQSTPKGRISLYLTKLLLIGVSVTVAYWAFFAIDYANLRSNWLLPDMDDLLVSFRDFKTVPTSFTFGGYFALTAVTGYLGALLISLVCVSVSQMLREPVFVYSICATVCFVPHFAQNLGVGACAYFNFTNLVNTNALFLMSNRVNEAKPFGWFAVFFALCAIAVSVLVTTSVKQIRNGLTE